jgi:hypothetical protein
MDGPYGNYALIKPGTEVYIPGTIEAIHLDGEEETTITYVVSLDCETKVCRESNDIIVNPLNMCSDEILEMELCRRKELKEETRTTTNGK